MTAEGLRGYLGSASSFGTRESSAPRPSRKAIGLNACDLLSLDIQGAGGIYLDWSGFGYSGEVCAVSWNSDSHQSRTSMDLPEICLSLDGRKAIALLELDRQWYPTKRAVHYRVAVVKLRPLANPDHAAIEATYFFKVLWNQPNQSVRWPEDFEAVFPELAVVAIGEFLDANDVPDSSTDDRYALTVQVDTDIFDLLRRTPATEEQLVRYAMGKIYWRWRYKLGDTTFGRHDGVRLGVSGEDIAHEAYRHLGSLWEQTSPSHFRALPGLINRFELEIKNGRASATSDGYDVALSFAGEQRQYVREIAELLRGAGIRVFYDDFEDLWGKDLTVRLENVYRRQARYVVIFVSQEYVAKAWPNLERQHALAGRIERLDDSVLPARFDGTELPGLPATVGYLDVSRMTASELADRIIQRVRAATNE